MKQFKLILFKILLINSIFLFFMSLYRLIFFLSYKTGIDLSGLGFDIFRAFYMGIRFDLSVLAGLNIPTALAFILFLSIGKTELFKYFFSFLKYYYTLIISILTLIFFIDFNFYSYFQDHLNILIYGFIEDDTSALLKTFYQNYNLFLIALAIIAITMAIFLLSKYILKLKNSTYKYPLPTPLMRIVISIIGSFVLFIMIRGTFSWNPIGVYSDISSNVFINKTAINCIFTLQRAIEQKQIENNAFDYIVLTGYQNNIQAAFADFTEKDISQIPQTEPENILKESTSFNAVLEKTKPNVILIIMESFGSDLIKYSSSDFDVLGELKKHFDEDIVFWNFASEGSITIVAIEALFLNTVFRMDTPTHLSQSKYVKNNYQFASMRPYKQKGYQTIFIYGDNTSWRNMGEFALNVGYDKAIGASILGYPRGPWGIFDKYLFELLFKELEQDNEDNTKSKFITILTTTNHPPYTLPSDYKVLPLNIPIALVRKIFDMDTAKKRFATYQYSNEMLGQFISKIKNSKYADNTIIAVTGDHSSHAHYVENIKDKIAVPFYLYIPKKLKPANYDLSVIGSHLDIMPTLYNISLSSAVYMSEGINLFSKKAATNSIVYRDRIIDGQYVVTFDVSNKETHYSIFNNGRLETVEAMPRHKALLKRLLSMTAISDYLIKNTGKQ